jgi:hypothetical protein
MLFDRNNAQQAPEVQNARIPPQIRQLLIYGAIFSLISASTASMMLCPCDSVGIRDHHAITLVAVAALLGIAASFMVYRRMRRDTGVTAFLRVAGAVAIVGLAVFAELSLAMYVVAWLARPR